ncbi:hypothetical protein EVAR_10195_1 [Eumeta japonica]|uniref:Uncharacterized protein n=1 Tax=Eumeta variegata TaxID=151549 RepID=A0A4C1TG21_EUMVA|nr:hypothetical protein EVAR_10195_1 [Eumeta japonica]
MTRSVRADRVRAAPGRAARSVRDLAPVKFTAARAPSAGPRPRCANDVKPAPSDDALAAPPAPLNKLLLQMQS